LYSSGSMMDLGTLGGSHSVGTSINASGQVTGKATIAGDSAQHAFLYSSGSMTDLGTLGGSSVGTSINASGQVTGLSLIAGQTVAHAFLYSSGSMYDLNNLISDGLPGGVYLGAPSVPAMATISINDSGWIIANG